jgi:hypothetical protein
VSDEKVQKELARYKNRNDIGKRHLPDGVTIRDTSLASETSLTISESLHRQGDSPNSAVVRGPSIPLPMTDYLLSMDSPFIHARSPTPTSDITWLLRDTEFFVQPASRYIKWKRTHVFLRPFATKKYLITCPRIKCTNLSSLSRVDLPAMERDVSMHRKDNATSPRANTTGDTKQAI